MSPSTAAGERVNPRGPAYDSASPSVMARAWLPPSAESMGSRHVHGPAQAVSCWPAVASSERRPLRQSPACSSAAELRDTASSSFPVFSLKVCRYRKSSNRPPHLRDKRSRDATSGHWLVHLVFNYYTPVGITPDRLWYRAVLILYHRLTTAGGSCQLIPSRLDSRRSKTRPHRHRSRSAWLPRRYRLRHLAMRAIADRPGSVIHARTDELPMLSTTVLSGLSPGEMRGDTRALTMDGVRRASTALPSRLCRRRASPAPVRPAEEASISETGLFAPLGGRRGCRPPAHPYPQAHLLRVADQRRFTVIAKNSRTQCRRHARSAASAMAGAFGIAEAGDLHLVAPSFRAITNDEHGSDMRPPAP